MKKKSLLIIAGFALGTVFAFSCSTSKKTASAPATNCVTPSPIFASDIKPIIENNCTNTGCHTRGGGDFRQAENLKRNADDGELKAIVVIEKSMPPRKSLTENEIKLIDCWIKDGAKIN